MSAMCSTPNNAYTQQDNDRPLASHFLLPKNPRFFFLSPSSSLYLLFFSSLPLPLGVESAPALPFSGIGRPAPELISMDTIAAVGGVGAGLSYGFGLLL